MKSGRSTLVGILLVVLLASLGLMAQNQQKEKDTKSILRVGVYDSRAVAIAYAGSKQCDDLLKQKMAERDQAQAAGDQATVDKLKAWGKAQQERLHQQGFGTAPVTDLLALIKDQIPQIATEAGVDLIVSKWQVDYVCPGADLVDMTSKIIAPFKPTQRALNWIEQLKDKAPLSREEIERHAD